VRRLSTRDIQRRALQAAADYPVTMLVAADAIQQD